MTNTLGLSFLDLWKMMADTSAAIEILHSSSPKFLNAAREAIAGKSICPVNALIAEMGQPYYQPNAADTEVLNFFKYVADLYKGNPGAALLQLDDFVGEVTDADRIIVGKAVDFGTPTPA